MTQTHVLVVDDDPKVLSLMRRGLAYAGYTVSLAAGGEEALAASLERRPDLVVLDVMLPGIDGLEVCTLLRAADPTLPILMLTARDCVPDDYMSKPFAFDELLARLRALLRRAGPDDSAVLRFSDLTLDPITRDVDRAGLPIQLTNREFELLEFFIRHARRLLPRELIFDRVWGSDYLGDSNCIDVHVMRLREKLEAGGQSRLIQTVRGAGYSLKEA
jgi:two-component system response regulator MprA